jgi:DNA topoisomerase-3
MRLIIAEKPSMGRTIAAALGLSASGRSLIEGNGLVVTWCVGHLLEAAEPHVYDEKLKRWALDSLPFFPEIFQYLPIKSTIEQYEVVSRLLKRDDIDDIVNATDAGREGELIFDLVYSLSGSRKPVMRFWASSLTDEAIKAAYASMKPGESYAGLRDAARCRQEADWLVGINCTRAQTLMMQRAGGKGVYSIGRVQTPTLAILVNRELEIRDFVPEDFWTLWAVFDTPDGTYKGKWFETTDGKDIDRFIREEDALALAARLSGLPAKVASVQAKTEKKRPELLYDLTTLQKEANKRFGFTAEHTLEVAQSLYESKLISYPRTNSRHLTEADAKKAPELLKSLDSGQLQELRPHIADLRKRWPVKLDKRFVNDAEVEDHPALIPTENVARTLSGDQLKLYELVSRRFLAAFFPDRLEAKTVLITRIDLSTFKTTGTVVKEYGWSVVDPPHQKPQKEPSKAKDGIEVEQEEDAELGQLPPVSKGQTVGVQSCAPKAGKTTPPKRMTEADLLSAMQGAGRLLDDNDLRGAMRDCGLGTPATRANIIETLLKRGYLERKRQTLLPTDKGVELIRQLQVEALKNPSLTGTWEARMERIHRGEDDRKSFMADIHAFVEETTSRIKSCVPPPQGAPKSLPCEICGKPMRVLSGTRKGQWFLRCSDCNVTVRCED